MSGNDVFVTQMNEAMNARIQTGTPQRVECRFPNLDRKVILYVCLEDDPLDKFVMDVENELEVQWEVH